MIKIIFFILFAVLDIRFLFGYTKETASAMYSIACFTVTCLMLLLALNKCKISLVFFLIILLLVLCFRPLFVVRQ